MCLVTLNLIGLHIYQDSSIPKRAPRKNKFWETPSQTITWQWQNRHAEESAWQRNLPATVDVQVLSTWRHIILFQKWHLQYESPCLNSCCVYAAINYLCIFKWDLTLHRLRYVGQLHIQYFIQYKWGWTVDWLLVVAAMWHQKLIQWLW